MKVNVYSVFDEKAGAYLQPFFMVNDAMAIRAVKNAVSDPDHNFSLNAADYTLFRVGTWDDDGGILTSEKTGLANLLELRAEKYDSVLGDTEQIKKIGGTN